MQRVPRFLRLSASRHIGDCVARARPHAAWLESGGIAETLDRIVRGGGS